MNDKALALFGQNYENKGLCEGLPNFIKTFEKEFKKTNVVKTISYLPWAVVERIFRMQGGKVEVVEWVNQVEFDFLDTVINEDGTFEVKNQKEHALFIHLQATWQDEVEDEFYPLFDNQNAKILKTPDALDLNTAKQRGMVRLIARISGVGLWVFEQQDTQFDYDGNPKLVGEQTIIKVTEKKDDETPKEEPKEVKEQEKKETKKRSKKESDKEVQKEALGEVVEVAKDEVAKDEPEVIPSKENTGFFGAFLAGKEIKPEVTPKEEVHEEEKSPSKPAKETSGEEFDNDTEEFASLLMDVRLVIRNGNLQSKAKEFVKEKKKETLSGLTYSELKELKEFLK